MGVRANEIDSWRLIESVVGIRGAHHPLTVKGRLPGTIGLPALLAGRAAVPFIPTIAMSGYAICISGELHLRIKRVPSIRSGR
jgi:hypothetical protein